MPIISQARITNLFLKAIAAATTTEVGRAYEDVVIYVMERIPGVELMARDVLNHSRSEEIDLVFWTDKNAADGLGRLLPSKTNTLLAEIKGWSSPVGAPALSEFATKLKNRDENLGIFVALSGVTGFKDNVPRGARERIRDALKEGVRIIVIKGSDLMNFRSSDDVREFFKEKLSQISASGSQED